MTGFDKLCKERKQILLLAEKHGASSIRVFGSVARGDDRPDSDIDFLVEMAPGRSLLDLGGLQMDLQESLSHPVDVVTRKGLKRRLRTRVLRESRPL